jgi:hypothetical protein
MKLIYYLFLFSSKKIINHILLVSKDNNLYNLYNLDNYTSILQYNKQQSRLLNKYNIQKQLDFKNPTSILQYNIYQIMLSKNYSIPKKQLE